VPERVLALSIFPQAAHAIASAYLFVLLMRRIKRTLVSWKGRM
jgi:hypothetical protein